MHTIVIMSDTMTHDCDTVKKLKELFPECNIQIISKTAKESGSRTTSPRLGNYPPLYNPDDQPIKIREMHAACKVAKI